MKIEIPFQTKIPFLNGDETLVYEVASIAEAVAQAIKNKDELIYADLRGAHLSDADLSHANLSYADLKHAILIRANLHYANLSDADLSDADLSDADLSDANLAWANLSNADLRHADLSYADLSNACLKNTDLGRADLSDADLTGANLSNADLGRADLSDANLTGAKLQDKKLWSKRPFLSLGQCGSADRTTLVFFFEDSSEPFIVCGCFEGGLAEFKERIEEEHSGTFHEEEYNAMVAYIQAIYKIQQEN